jgi:[NiFe] hydrogenase small subunit
MAGSTQVAVAGSDFRDFCAEVAGLLGLDGRFVPRVAAFLSALQRLPIVWFQFTACGLCRQPFVQGPHRWAGDLLVAHLPDDAGAGPSRGGNLVTELAVALRTHSGKYLCVVEGAPPALHGSPSMARMLRVAAEVCSNARAVLCVGSCTATTALAAAAATPVLTDAFGLPAMHVPGCPPTPVAFAAALVAHLLGSAGVLPAASNDGPALQVVPSVGA